jgi:hypothetical protein
MQIATASATPNSQQAIRFDEFVGRFGSRGRTPNAACTSDNEALRRLTGAELER